ncbi:hypothetical protein MAR_005229 [Mya arenaria]|uniref:Uncharacterized protein n=1 Tax=Mya arenaria TaxID=6604 RepID=A0ABY7F2Y2_MYAAR|nr:hypothetical protein MAR_005183 [Mya arenaria]WAR15124.1 hypothetical protein MAR_005229 [Mya arenaria]
MGVTEAAPRHLPTHNERKPFILTAVFHTTKRNGSESDGNRKVGNNERKKCIFSDFPHDNECKTITSVIERKFIVKSKGPCFNCLSNRHIQSAVSLDRDVASAMENTIQASVRRPLQRHLQERLLKTTSPHMLVQTIKRLPCIPRRISPSPTFC